MEITRRELCVGVASLGAAVLIGCKSTGSGKSTPRISFEHGLASFDPSHDGVLLWTRVTGTDDAVDVDYVVAEDPGLGHIVDKGTVSSDPSADHTVVADITGLDAATTYFYAFSGPGATTKTARFRTMSSGPLDALRLGIVCCSNHAYGYFAGYAAMARRNDIDAVLHLGDYIYEYGPGDYDDDSLPERAHEPPHEALTLSDYRTRYAQYRRDPDLQELHRQHSFFCIWDDHEFADNSYLDGANNHQSNEGDWSKRRAAATQACFEWVPRRRHGNKIYRSIRMGDLADLVLLDTRMAGREKQPLFATVSRDPDRELLGEEQEEFVTTTLEQSVDDGVPWRILGQQVMVAPLRFGGQVVNADQWDGYPNGRARLLELIDKSGDCVVLTGDIHSSWALDIPKDPTAYDPITGTGSVAVEFVSPGITSPAVPGKLGPLGGAAIADLAKRQPHIRWADISRRGFVVIDVDRERVQADWYHLHDVKARDREAQFAMAFRSDAGARHLVEVSEPVPTKPGPPRAP